MAARGFVLMNDHRLDCYLTGDIHSLHYLAKKAHVCRFGWDVLKRKEKTDRGESGPGILTKAQKALPLGCFFAFPISCGLVLFQPVPHATTGYEAPSLGAATLDLENP